MTRWMFDEFAPVVSAHFGGLLYFSYLISPAHLAAAEAFRGQQDTPAASALPFRLHYASQESEAVQWLLEAQAAEAGRSLISGATLHLLLHCTATSYFLT